MLHWRQDRRVLWSGNGGKVEFGLDHFVPTGLCELRGQTLHDQSWFWLNLFLYPISSSGIYRCYLVVPLSCLSIIRSDKLDLNLLME